MVVEIRREGCDPREGDIIKVVVDLVGEDEEVMLQADVADALEFWFCEDFSDGIVTAGWVVSCWVSEV